ncbi:UNVERIFIED_CONTAM: hypothetical protein FKN15_023350 [Acipenser sinensis]
MSTRCPPKRVPSAARFFTHCKLTVQPPQSYSVGGQRSSGQLTGKPAGAWPDYRGRWCAIYENWLLFGRIQKPLPFEELLSVLIFYTKLPYIGRFGKTGSLTVQELKSSQTPTVKTATSPGTSTVLDVNKSTLVFVGGLGGQIKKSSAVKMTHFKGCMGGASLNGNNIGLWNYAEREGKCRGCFMSPQDEDTSFHFDGSGYSVVEKALRSTVTQIVMLFKTFSPNGLLLYLASNGTSLSKCQYSSVLMFWEFNSVEFMSFQRRLGDAAKKAISKLQVRTIRKGDKPNADCVDDIPPDYEGSIGGPPTNRITGTSELTVNESSVVLDPAIHAVGLPQVFQDSEPTPQAGEIIITTSKCSDPQTEAPGLGDFHTAVILEPSSRACHGATSELHALGNLQAGLQAPGRSTGVAGARPAMEPPQSYTLWATYRQASRLPASPQGSLVRGTECLVLVGLADHSRVNRKPATQEGGGVTVPEVIALKRLVSAVQLLQQHRQCCVVHPSSDNHVWQSGNYVQKMKLIVEMMFCTEYRGDQEPAVSSDSDTSLIMGVEVGISDVEILTDQDNEEVKS